MSELEIGRLLRANITRCVLGCKVSQLDAPAFGGMVRIPIGIANAAYGLIYDIHIDDDGLVRQLVTAEHISEEVIEDNRKTGMCRWKLAPCLSAGRMKTVFHTCCRLDRL